MQSHTGGDNKTRAIPSSHNMAFDTKLTWRIAQCEPDHLRKMKHGNRVLDIGFFQRFRLVTVKHRMTKRTRRHDKIGFCIYSLSKRFSRNIKRFVFGDKQRMETTALVFMLIRNCFSAQRLDQLIKRRWFERVVLAQQCRRAKNMAAIEGRDPVIAQRNFDFLTDKIEPHILDEHPQKVTDFRCPLVLEALFLQNTVDLISQRR